jgi:hypothetical protein
LAATLFLASGGLASGQTIQPPYNQAYTLSDLGQVPGLPIPYGALDFLPGNPNVIVIGGSGDNPDGAFYSIGVVRNAQSQITGFSGTTVLFSDGQFNDGGAVFGPGGVFFYTRYPANEVGQVKPGSAITDKIIDLDRLGVSPSGVGALNFVPAGFPGAGQLKIVSYQTGDWYTASYAPDGAGTYDITSATFNTTISDGSEAFVYVPAGSPTFLGSSLLVSEYRYGVVSIFQIDANGNPNPATRSLFIDGFPGVLGAVIDPLTGDCLFSTFRGDSPNRVVVVRGFRAPTEPGPVSVTLPAAASLHGAPPTFFHSDVSVFNPSATQTATVTARYRCFTGVCGNAVQTFMVPPRQLRVFDDIVGTLFGAAETGGAVEFTGNVLVDSRLYTPSRPAPTVGMYVPGLSPAEAYAEAVVTSLSFSANLSTGFRTNVGVYNGNDVGQTVTFTLFNPQGVQIGQTSQLVPARTPLQINNIASFVGITTDVPSFYVVVRGDGTSRNYVYAAVLDNQSQDLIFVKGANNAAAPAGTVTLPAVASLHGAPPTSFHSDVSVFNPSATQAPTVTARYRCFTGACGNAVQTFTVPPRQLRVFDDIVATLFGAPETGGAVEFSGNVPVDSRLYTPSRPAPTVGMYVPELSAAEAYAEAVVTSLSFSANLSTGFRTNVGVYNGNDVAQTVTFTLYNPQGVQIGQTVQAVPARTPLQINNIAGFVGITTDVPSFYCVVRGDGLSKNYAYAAVLDNQSQDLIFVKGAESRSP